MSQYHDDVRAVFPSDDASYSQLRMAITAMRGGRETTDGGFLVVFDKRAWARVLLMLEAAERVVTEKRKAI